VKRRLNGLKQKELLICVVLPERNNPKVFDEVGSGPNRKDEQRFMVQQSWD
jgi:hypothetical protein